MRRSSPSAGCRSIPGSTSWTRRISPTRSCLPLDVVQVGRGRFDAILVSGDEGEVDHNMTKARMVLGYAPKGQPLLED